MKPRLPHILMVTLLATTVQAQEAAAPPQPPQDPAAAKDLQRAAAVRLELLREWTWGEDGAPTLAATAAGPQLPKLHFRGDGGALAVSVARATHVVPVTEGAFAPLPVPPGNTVQGPAQQGFVSAGNDAQLLLPGAEPRDLGFELPRGVIAFPSPVSAHLLGVGIGADRQIRAELWAYGGDKPGAAIRLEPPEGAQLRASAAAWSPDGQRLAVTWAALTSGSRKCVAIDVCGLDGKVQRRIALEPQGWITALDFGFDGRALVWADERLHRTTVAEGPVQDGPAAQVLLWATIDPVVAVSVDKDGIALWDGNRLQQGARVPAAEKPLEVRNRSIGPILAAAIAPKRDVLAVATVQGLRLYRLRP